MSSFIYFAYFNYIYRKYFAWMCHHSPLCFCDSCYCFFISALKKIEIVWLFQIWPLGQNIFFVRICSFANKQSPFFRNDDSNFRRRKKCGMSLSLVVLGLCDLGYCDKIVRTVQFCFRLHFKQMNVIANCIHDAHVTTYFQNKQFFVFFFTSVKHLKCVYCLTQID